MHVTYVEQHDLCTEVTSKALDVIRTEMDAADRVAMDMTLNGTLHARTLRLKTDAVVWQILYEAERQASAALDRGYREAEAIESDARAYASELRRGTAHRLLARLEGLRDDGAPAFPEPTYPLASRFRAAPLQLPVAPERTAPPMPAAVSEPVRVLEPAIAAVPPADDVPQAPAPDAQPPEQPVTFMDVLRARRATARVPHAEQGDEALPVGPRQEGIWISPAVTSPNPMPATADAGPGGVAMEDSSARLETLVEAIRTLRARYTPDAEAASVAA